MTFHAPPSTGRFSADSAPACARNAPRYDRSHRRWLDSGGRQAQDAFDGAVAALVEPGFRVLDAGCGAGAVAKRLTRLCHGQLEVSLLDACPELLARTGPLPEARALARFEDIPFPSDRFDLVTSAWALEATPRPLKALGELVRVTRPGGTVCFVAHADFGRGPLVQRLVPRNMRRRGLGRRLAAEVVEEIPYHFTKARVRLLQIGQTSLLGLIRKEGGTNRP